MAVGDAYVFPGFLTQLFFPKPPTTFPTCFCRGERRKYAGKKSRLNRGSNSQLPGHESDMLTTEPPGRGFLIIKLPLIATIGTLRIIVKYRPRSPHNILNLLPHCSEFKATQGKKTFNSVCFVFISRLMSTFETLSQATNFRVFLTQRVCRRQF